MKFCRIYWQWILIEQTFLYTVVYRTFLYNPTNLKVPKKAPCVIYKCGGPQFDKLLVSRHCLIRGLTKGLAIIIVLVRMAYPRSHMQPGWGLRENPQHRFIDRRPSAAIRYAQNILLRQASSRTHALCSNKPFSFITHLWSSCHSGFRKMEARLGVLR